MTRAGGRLVIAPVGPAAQRWSATVPGEASIIRDGAEDVARVFGLFGPPTQTGDALPSHAEFLIDRQGYLRARWWPGAGGWIGWDLPSALIDVVQRLAAEPPRAPPPDEHVH